MTTKLSTPALRQAAAESEVVRRALARLTPREEQVVRMYYGIELTSCARRCYNMNEIGARFALTRSRISQILAVALFKLIPLLETQCALLALLVEPEDDPRPPAS